MNYSPQSLTTQLSHWRQTSSVHFIECVWFGNFSPSLLLLLLPSYLFTIETRKIKGERRGRINHVTCVISVKKLDVCPHSWLDSLAFTEKFIHQVIECMSACAIRTDWQGIGVLAIIKTFAPFCWYVRNFRPLFSFREFTCICFCEKWTRMVRSVLYDDTNNVERQILVSL